LHIFTNCFLENKNVISIIALKKNKFKIICVNYYEHAFMINVYRKIYLIELTGNSVENKRSKILVINLQDGSIY